MNFVIGKDIVGVNRDFEDLLRCLNHAKARYLVVGAYAVIFYTEPRYTKDLDVWIEPNRIDILMGVDGVTFEKAWKRHRITKYGNQKTAMIDIDDLIKNKHAVGRAQDMIDIAFLKRAKLTRQNKAKHSTRKNKNRKS